MRRSLIPLLLVALPVSIAAQATPTPAQGWMQASRTVTDSGANRGTFTIATRTEMLNGKMRMTNEISSSPALARGMYSIFDSDAHTVTNVLPSSRWASITDMAALAGVAGIVKFEVVGEPTLDVQDLGPGDPILGYATRHYRYRTDYSMKYTIGDSTCTRRLVRSTEAWVAPDLVMGPHGMAADMMRITAGSSPLVVTGFADKIDPLIQSKMKGTALKTIAQRPNSMIPGDSANIVATMEVTELAHGVDPSIFEIPSGFQLTDTRETKVDTATFGAAMRTTMLAKMIPMLCGGNR